MAFNISDRKIIIGGFLCLGLACIFYVLSSWLNSGKDHYYQQIEKNLHRQLSLAEAGLRLVEHNLSAEADEPFSGLPSALPFNYYIYKNKNIWYWSDYHFVPPYENLSGNFKKRYLDIKEGKFTALKKTVKNPGREEGTFEIVMLVPLLTEKVQDEDGKKYNPKIFAGPAFSLHPPGQEAENAASVHSEEGKELFRVKVEKNYTAGSGYLQLFTAVFLLLAVLLFVTVLFRLSLQYIKRAEVMAGFGVLASGFLVIRAAMLMTGFPYSLYPFSLFNPEYYASSFINPSLGDFLLNTLSLFLLAILLFQLWRRQDRNIRGWFTERKGNRKLIVGMAIFHFLILWVHYRLLQELFFHGQFTLDITSSLEVHSFKIVSWLIFSLLTFIYILLNYISGVCMYDLLKTRREGAYIYSFIALVLLAAGIWRPELRFVAVAVTLYLLLFHFLQQRNASQPYNYQIFVFIISGALISSLAGSLALYDYYKQNRLMVKERFANQLLTDHDLIGEYLLSEAVEKIKEDPFIKSRYFSPIFGKEGIVQKIRRQYLTRYFDKYDVRVLLFNVDGSVINQPNRYLNYHLLKHQAKENGIETDYPDLYLLNDPVPGTTGKRYQQFIPVMQGSRPLGYIMIDMVLKRYLPNTIYPELFLGNSLQDPQSSRLNYAIFREGRMEYNAGSFDYVHQLPPGLLEKEAIYESGIEAEGYHHLAVRDQQGKVVIVSDVSEPASFITSNFSFLFLLNLLWVTLGVLGYVSYFGFSIKRLDFTTKIQLYLNFAVFIPLVVVSITTLSLINSSFKEETERRYFEKAESISRNLAEVLEDQPLFGAPGRPEELSAVLTRIARYAEADIHLFNIRGRLLATNQPVIYQQNYLSEFINPEALAQIREQNSRQVILNETVNNLQYKSAYMAVRSTRDGSLMGILSLPFFESGYQLDQQLSAVFSNIVNIFAFLFILFIGLLYFLSRELTEPLRYIAQKMRQLSLTGKNEPLRWTADDEIGKLVREYNTMLANLQESKEALSRSEKESAWREMAKQVAHEIKNPLTPMKLSLQHLNRVMRDKLANSRDGEMVDKSVKSMLDQIDTLSDIATSFSAFAKMPVPRQERFNIADLLKGVVRLYSNQEHKIISNIEEGDFWVCGDEQMMQRTFNNLILNGIQSVPESEEAVIEVHLKPEDSRRVLIMIRDNGGGIDPSIQEKVFVPNFSTKYSGSGLGLAIAKRGIEHAGGRIWFETERGKGTRFYIELPLTE